MSSFFTVPGAHKKRKQTGASEPPKKRINASKTSSKPSSSSRAPAKSAPNKSKRPERDESISGSDSEDYDSDASIPEHSGSDNGSDDDTDNEGETAAERRLRLAERYLSNVRKEVEVAGDEYAFDAEDVDKDLIAERLIEDAAETKGKVYRHLAKSLEFERASHTMFRWNTENVTSVALCSPYAYTTSKDGYLVKWKLQDLPKDQYPQTTAKKPKKPPAPPRRRPERIASVRSDPSKAKDRTFQGHTGGILVVAASQDGKFVVTGGADKRLVVHDAETLKPLRAFTHHRDAVTGLAFRRGTNQLYSCSRDRTVKVWSLDELAYVETLFGHQDDVVDIDALAQERCVSVGARDRTARLWKVVEETQLVFRGGGGDSSSSKKKRKGDAPVTEEGGEGLDPISLAHEGCMDRVAMIDDELFVTGSDNGAIALWSIQKKKPLYVLPRAHGLDPKLLPTEVSAEQNPDPKVVPAPQPRWITALKTIPYSDVILSGSWDGCVRVWKLSEDKRKIEPVCVLGVPSSSGEDADEQNVNGDHEETKANVGGSNGASIKGVVNDIAMFERGDRGRDGLCVVTAIGKEHRLGRWKVIKGARNGAMVFEVPRVPKATSNGVGESDSDEDEDE